MKCLIGKYVVVQLLLHQAFASACCAADGWHATSAAVRLRDVPDAVFRAQYNHNSGLKSKKEIRKQMTHQDVRWPDRPAAASIQVFQDCKQASIHPSSTAYKQACAGKLPLTIQMQSGLWSNDFIDQELHHYALVEVYLSRLFSTMQAGWPLRR